MVALDIVIFQQLKGLGRSYNSEIYGISRLDEAKAYIDHRVLGQRLREVCHVILGLPPNGARDYSYVEGNTFMNINVNH